MPVSSAVTAQDPCVRDVSQTDGALLFPILAPGLSWRESVGWVEAVLEWLPGEKLMQGSNSCFHSIHKYQGAPPAGVRVVPASGKKLRTGILGQANRGP